jgi:hypothetical protein
MNQTVQTVTASSTSHPRPLPRLGGAENDGGRCLTALVRGVCPSPAMVVAGRIRAGKRKILLHGRFFSSF